MIKMSKDQFKYNKTSRHTKDESFHHG